MVSSVADAALTLEVISGHDERDSTTSLQPVPQFSQNLTTNIKGLRIGLQKEYMKDGLDPDVQKTVNDAIEALKKLGAEIVEVSVPLTEDSVPMYYLIASSEASSNLARYDGVKYGYRADFSSLSGVDLDKFYADTRGQGFGEEVKRRIMLGTFVLSAGYVDAYYTKAQKVRQLVKQKTEEIFSQYDYILSPTTPTTAFKFGEKSDNPIAMYLADIFTVHANIAGIPAVSIPIARDSNGMSIGVQLMGKAFDEAALLSLAASLK
jgi:aspartyl-tRNA(Asn)/glutamyl-tRNA(Gln) amidotransferase subunit A